jgi:hypothetical protein
MPRGSTRFTLRTGMMHSTRHNGDIGRNPEDRRVEVDDHGTVTGTDPEGPGPGHEYLGQLVELTD